jgi:hypothetical protein
MPGTFLPSNVGLGRGVTPAFAFPPYGYPLQVRIATLLCHGAELKCVVMPHSNPHSLLEEAWGRHHFRHHFHTTASFLLKCKARLFPTVVQEGLSGALHR